MSESLANALSSKYDPAAVEAHWYKVWEDAGYFRADPQAKGPSFTIVLPPPNVTGSLHMGHAMYVLEDVMIRHHRMRGEPTLWLPGTDHAGIATQLVVERKLRKEQNLSRHDLGREAFVERVWSWKKESGNRIYEQLRTMGFSLDWSRERFTMDPGLSRSVRAAFVSLYKDDLLYRDTRLINWCPRCITALSDLEVDDTERAGHLWHIRYPVPGSDLSLVVATTRPETMLGDTAVAVHPEDLRFRELIGTHVTLPLTGREIPVVGDAILVDPTFGTGAVKVTPGHDFNDYETGKRHNLPIISIFDDHGRCNDKAPERYRGLTTQEARKKVLEELAEAGLLVETRDHKLMLPVCQRCSTVVEPMVSTQWFVRTKPLARPSIAAVENGFTKIYPEGWDKTYFHWMRNIQDWCVSRQLWWGHQIPAWYCEKGHVTVADKAPEACDTCGSTSLTQDPDVLDTWFSSALWPFSTLGWPDKTEDLHAFYPNSVLETGFDILFFWVARMMMMGCYLMGAVPFRAVYLHGLVRDDEGEKMSKVKGNVIDPLDVVYGISHEAFVKKIEEGGASAEQVGKMAKKYPQGIPALGVDALRFALTIQATAGRDIKFDIARVTEYRTFANKIWNASRFALMNLSDFDAASYVYRAEEASAYDRWIRHRCGEVAAEMDRAYGEMEFAEAAQLIYHFVWNEVCDWYIELAKSSFFAEASQTARRQSQGTLVFVLDAALRMLHPIMPFLSEEIWQKLPKLSEAQGGSASSAAAIVAPFPGSAAAVGFVAAAARDEQALEGFGLLRDVVTAVRNLRGELTIAPSQKLTVYVSGPERAIAVLQSESNILLRLAGISGLAAESERPAGVSAGALVVHTWGNLELSISLVGIVDIEAEKARLQKELSKTQKELEKIRQKLANESFVSRAPQEILEKEREKESREAARLASLEKQLARFA